MWRDCPNSTTKMSRDTPEPISYLARSFRGGVLLLRLAKLCLSAAAVAALFACSPDYSPNTYSSSAVQKANKVEPGVVIGFRQVEISANGTVGAVAGGAAGGILGAQADSGGIYSALGGVGGTLVGSVVGTTIEHATGDTTGWEYIVREPNGDLLSVTQREPKPIPIGQKVLVITGNQARIIPDYSVAVTEPQSDKNDKTDKTSARKADSRKPAKMTDEKKDETPATAADGGGAGEGDADKA